MIEMMILIWMGSGCVNLSQWEVFNPSLFDVSKNGVVCIADRDNCRLVFLDKERNLIAISGRKGAGPGEFKSLANVAWEANGGLFWIYEWRGRLSSWNEKGEMTGEYPMKAVLRDFMCVNQDTILYVADDSGRIGTSPKIMLTDLKNETDRVIWEAPTLSVESGHHRSANPAFSFKLPWDPRVVTALGGGLFVACYNNTNEVLVYQTSTLSKLNTIRPVSKTNKVTNNSFKTAIRERFIDKETYVDIAPYIKQNPDTFWPIVQALKIDDMQRIWIYTATKDHKKYSVYNVEGKHLGINGTTSVDPRYIVFRAGAKYECIENSSGDILLCESKPH